MLIRSLTICISLGRSERSASISEDVITTAVCPRYLSSCKPLQTQLLWSRSRPEGKRISPPPGLQPPPSLPPRKMGERQTAQVWTRSSSLEVGWGRISPRTWYLLPPRHQLLQRLLVQVSPQTWTLSPSQTTTTMEVVLQITGGSPNLINSSCSTSESSSRPLPNKCSGWITAPASPKDPLTLAPSLRRAAVPRPQPTEHSSPVQEPAAALWG